MKLTEEEFHQACAIIAALGQRTTESHNEVVLMSGSLGVSTLVCLLNNGNNGQTETTANLLGPFWRLDSPRTENGGSIVRSPTPGPTVVRQRSSGIRAASRSPAPRSTSGIPRPRAITRTRTRRRPT